MARQTGFSSLRPMIIKLAAMREQDRKRVLDLLDPQERNRVVTLLNDLEPDHGYGQGTPEPLAWPLSPWLLSLLNESVLADRTRRSLMENATDLFGETSQTAPAVPAKGASLIDRLLGRIPARRRA